jgi:hypothetical protein
MQAARHDEQYRINSIAARPCKKRKDGARVPLSGKQNSPWRKLRHPSEEKPREQTKGPVGGGPSYRGAKGGAFDLFHHKRAVRAITDIQPSVGDNGDRPVWQGRAVPVNQDDPRSRLSPTRRCSLTT